MGPTTRVIDKQIYRVIPEETWDAVVKALEDTQQLVHAHCCVAALHLQNLHVPQCHRGSIALDLALKVKP